MKRLSSTAVRVPETKLVKVNTATKKTKPTGSHYGPKGQKSWY